MKLQPKMMPQLIADLKARKDVEFSVPQSATGFNGIPAPSDWQAFPPASLRDEDYAYIMTKAGDGIDGAVITIEISVHIAGGRILYKQTAPDEVSMKITWP